MNPSDYDKNPGIGEINFDDHAAPGERWRDAAGREAMRCRASTGQPPFNSVLPKKEWVRPRYDPTEWGQPSTGQATNDNAASAWDWQRIIAALVCMAVCVIVWALLFKPLVYGLADALAWVRGLV